MIKKTRLSFSSISKDGNEQKVPARTTDIVQSGGENKTAQQRTHPARRTSGEGYKKNSSKSSTYQYSKKGFGGGRGGKFSGKDSPRPQREDKIPPVEKDVIRVVPLGGVEEVGRNMILVESENDIVILDMGFHFIDEEEAMGADFTLPNFKYLEERKDKIRAVVITHGHLDHIGGIPFINERLGNPPIYAQFLTTLMIKKRQEEFVGAKPLIINVVDQDTKIRFNELSLGFFPVYHSIPDSMGAIVGTPFGNIIVSGDMKLDHDAGKPTAKEEKKWGALGK